MWKSSYPMLLEIKSCQCLIGQIWYTCLGHRCKGTGKTNNLAFSTSMGEHIFSTKIWESIRKFWNRAHYQMPNEQNQWAIFTRKLELIFWWAKKTKTQVMLEYKKCLKTAFAKSSDFSPGTTNALTPFYICLWSELSCNHLAATLDSRKDRLDG